jgi:hypothetical protein
MSMNICQTAFQMIVLFISYWFCTQILLTYYTNKLKPFPETTLPHNCCSFHEHCCL